MNRNTREHGHETVAEVGTRDPGLIGAGTAPYGSELPLLPVATSEEPLQNPDRRGAEL